MAGRVQHLGTIIHRCIRDANRGFSLPWGHPIQHGASLQPVDPQLGAAVAGGPEAALPDTQSRHLGEAGGQVGLTGGQLGERFGNQETDFLQGADYVHLEREWGECECVGQRKTSQSQYSIY